jgi:hypothetical protein
LQVPTAPATLQAWQVPVHALLQQTPRTQKPERQSPAAAHRPPASALGAQTPPGAQYAFGAQSAAVVQAVLQAPVPQAKGAQDDASAGRHMPVPLQVRAALSMTPLQLAAPHSRPAAYCRQAPMPLQTPSLPQEVTPSSLQ